MKIIIILSMLLMSCVHTKSNVPHKYKFTCTDGHKVHGYITQDELQDSYLLWNKIDKLCNG